MRHARLASGMRQKMKGLLSLDQELRAIRKPKGQGGLPGFRRPADPIEAERPWRPELDQVQQTMQEVLRAVAGFSGVELPGLPASVPDDQTLSPSLDIKTLKDRFRNDLEGFSIKTTQELANRAREQTRVALEAVQNDVGGMVERVASEFRENLQLPAQIEKLLEPCVEDAESRLANSLSQKFDHLVVRHKQLVDEKLQQTLSDVHAQLSALEEAVQQIRDLKAQSSSQQPSAADVEKLLAEHDCSVQGRLHEALAPVQAQMSGLEETVRQVRELNAQTAAQASTAEVSGRIDNLESELREKFQDQAQIEKLVEPRVEQAAARLEESLSQKVEHLVTQHEQLVQEQVQGTLNSVQTQMSTLGQTVRNLKADWVAQTSANQAGSAEVVGRIDQLAAEFMEKLQDPEGIESLLELRVEESAARLEKSICQKVENVVARHEALVEEKLQGTLSMFQQQMSALEQTVQQIRELKARPVAQAPAEQPVVASEDATKLGENNLKLDLNGFLDQAFSRIEFSFNNLRESRKLQSAQNSGSNLEYLRKAIPTGSPDMLVRVQQALDNLDRLGTKDPQTAS
jgi:myosin heavy subunit